jgi:hypothetical protein
MKHTDDSYGATLTAEHTAARAAGGRSTLGKLALLGLSVLTFSAVSSRGVGTLLTSKWELVPEVWPSTRDQRSISSSKISGPPPDLAPHQAHEGALGGPHDQLIKSLEQSSYCWFRDLGPTSRIIGCDAICMPPCLSWMDNREENVQGRVDNRAT